MCKKKIWAWIRKNAQNSPKLLGPLSKFWGSQEPYLRLVPPVAVPTTIEYIALESNLTIGPTGPEYEASKILLFLSSIWLNTWTVLTWGPPPTSRESHPLVQVYSAEDQDTKLEDHQRCVHPLPTLLILLLPEHLGSVFPTHPHGCLLIGVPPHSYLSLSYCHVYTLGCNCFDSPPEMFVTSLSEISISHDITVEQGYQYPLP